MKQRISGNYEQFLPDNKKSRWASIEEIQRSTSFINGCDKQYAAAGMPVLSDGEKFYVDNTDTHSLIFGSTGSKKTRLFCMPMLDIFCRAGESFIVTDPKGELFECTSGEAKANGFNIITLDYRNLGAGDMWNPLTKPYELYKAGNEDEAVTMLNDFVASIAAPYDGMGNDPFWTSMSSSLALANLLLLMECGKKEEVHPASFANLCSAKSLDKLEDIVRYNIDPESIAGMNYNGVFVSADKTKQSIFVSLFAMVNVFNTQKKLTRMLSDSSFDICDIGRRKTAVYIIVPDEKTTYNFLITTFIKQAYQTLIAESQKEKDGKLPIRVNFVLDEFCNIPKIDDMPAMISAARSRNIRFYLFVQSLHQLRERYGDSSDTIKGNCENWVFLASKELALLEEISELCGRNNNVPLINTSELQHLRKDIGEALIIQGRNFPIVTELADIDDYRVFEKLPQAEREIKIPDKLAFFNLDSVKEMLGNRVLFSEENGEKTNIGSYAEYIQSVVDKQTAIIDKKLSELEAAARKISEKEALEALEMQASVRDELEKEFENILRQVNG